MIRKSFLWLLTTLCVIAQVKAQEFINDKVDVLAGSSTYYLNEVIYKPANFSTTKKYPLVMFFHGMGEAGTNINLMYNTGLPYVLKNGYKPPFEFIMVAPQHNSYSLDPNHINQVLDEAIRRFPNIDQSRIYLTGLSAGGYTIYLGQLNVNTDVIKRFAALVVMSGATQGVNTANYPWWKISQTPLWAVVGNDDISYRDQNIDVVNRVNQQVPGAAAITIRSGYGHGGWNDVYNGSVKTANGMNMWDWMYQFQRTSTG
ncbi:MAG TPA: hypothetical protein VHK91_06270, partial [Flavisolibacter sp.]|nr:hypothetical protein [Flavisolibacter sp.]